MIGVDGEASAALALKTFPDRFIPSGAISDPNDVMGSVNAIRREYEQYGIRATSVFPAGTFPQVPIDDPKMYPDLRHLRRTRHPDLRLRGRARSASSVRAARGGRIDRRDVRLPRSGVRHPPRLRALGGPRRQADAEVAEPVLLDVGVRSQVLPEGDPRLRELRGADKVLYAGYFPVGLSLERIFARATRMFPCSDEVWPKFLYGNAARILGLDG